MRGSDVPAKIAEALQPLILPFVQVLLFVVLCVLVRWVFRLLVGALRWFNGKPVPTPRTQWQDARWSDSQIQAACGMYHSDEGADIELFDDGGKIGLRLAGQPKSCIAVYNDTILIPEAFEDKDVLLLADESRGVWGLRYGGRILSRV